MIFIKILHFSLFIFQEEEDDATTMDEKVSLFTSTHDVVMLDVGTHLNLCSSVSTNAYRELRKEASATSEWLNRDTGGSLGK